MGISGFLTFARAIGVFQDSGDIDIDNSDSEGALRIRIGSNTVTKVRTVEVSTTDATPTVALAQSVSLSGAVSALVFGTAKKEGVNADGLVSFVYNAATNNAGTTALVGSSGGSNVENSAGAPTWTVVANDANDTLDIVATGVAAENYTFRAVVITIETV